MKKVLIPVDFRPISKTTCQYAWDYLKAISPVEIHLVHCFMPALEGEYPNIAPPVNEILEAEEQQLKNFVLELQAEGIMLPGKGVEIKEKFIIDNPVSGVSKLSEHFDLILMGTHGNDSLLDQLLGTKTSIVSQKAKCPILVLPSNVKFKGIRHILYATNMDSADDDALEMVQKINAPFKATVHFVHVKNKSRSNFTAIQAELVGELFEDGTPNFAFEVEEVPGAKVTDTLIEYAENHSVDLMLIASKHRNFWEGFFHQSQSKRLAKATPFPLLIYHFD